MRELLVKLLDGEALTAAEAETAFGHIMAGEAETAAVAAFLTALRMRGPKPEEIAGGVRALRRAMIVADLPGDRLVDTCGTGGGGLTTFNISTAAGLLAAAAGARVAKHGNRSFSSRCGSADLLEALGVSVDVAPERLPRVLRETGFAFMFAPRFHPAVRHVGPVRRVLGVATIFNLLGPLANPARVGRQVVGVSDPGLLWLMAEALRELGHERALVVHGEPGMDELSPVGATRAVRLDRAELEEVEIDPAEFGWEGLDVTELRGEGPPENAARVEAVLAGREEGAARAAVLLNAGAALWAGGEADGIAQGVERAREAIDDGRAGSILERLRELSEAEKG